MANIFASDYNKKPISRANAWNENYSVAVAAVNADKLYMGVIPGGIEVEEVSLITDACGAAVTLSVGYEPVDATNGPAAALTAFHNARASSSAGRNINTGHPIRFDFDVKLVVTVGGANLVGTPKITVVVGGLFLGKK